MLLVNACAWKYFFQRENKTVRTPYHCWMHIKIFLSKGKTRLSELHTIAECTSICSLSELDTIAECMSICSLSELHTIAECTSMCSLSDHHTIAECTSEYSLSELHTLLNARQYDLPQTHVHIMTLICTFKVLIAFGSPWYDLRGWLGVKHQLSTYLSFPKGTWDCQNSTYRWWMHNPVKAVDDVAHNWVAARRLDDLGRFWGLPLSNHVLKMDRESNKRTASSTSSMLTINKLYTASAAQASLPMS